MAASADEDRTDAASASGQRLDKWLWFARVVKSRTQAAGLVTSGKVRVNRAKVDKPAHGLKPGDVVTVSVGRKIRILKVVAAGVRRGPASEAQGLFEEVMPAVAAPVAGAQSRSRVDRPATAQPAEREPGAGRPTKRDRRLIDEWRGRR